MFTGFKIECAAPVIPAITLLDVEAKDAGQIPTNLAALTQLVIELHRANGDLGWVVDMVNDAEVVARS